MNAIRSLIFAVGLVVTIPPYALFSFLTFPLPPIVRYRIISSWALLAVWMARHFLGIRYRVIGRENLPAQASVILAKHQSAWETLAFQKIFPPLSFVLKRELLRIPFFGWGLAQMPFVAIDRAGGKEALAQVVERGGARLREGFWVVVFPEGTRVKVGTSARYKIGGAWLATHVGAKVVPVAHNAGEFWPKEAFIKRPGEIIVSIGPAIETAGRAPEEVNAEAERWIEGEMRRLFPHHYGVPARV
jgi:1-acyl-sn-glycerol-3-phosphate acyltransferase